MIHRQRGLHGTIHRQTQAHIGGAIVLGTAHASCHATVAQIAVPSTATHHAGHLAATEFRIQSDGVELVIGTVSAINVLTPFPHIAAHVIDTQLVGRFLGYLMRGAAAVTLVPAQVRHRVGTGIFVAHRQASASSGIFPLGLGQHAVLTSSHLVQAPDEFLAVLPGHLLHGRLLILEVAGVTAHDALPQALRHLGLADVVGRHSHLVNRRLVGLSRGTLVTGSTPDEGTAVYQNHVRFIEQFIGAGDNAATIRLVDNHCEIGSGQGDIVNDLDIGRADLQALQREDFALLQTGGDGRITII